jgi:hypothetical protein
MSFHSHSHIFLIFFLIHTIFLLHFFLTDHYWTLSHKDIYLTLMKDMYWSKWLLCSYSCFSIWPLYLCSHVLSLSLSYIFNILSHSYNFLTTFLSHFLYNVDILFCSIYSLKHFFMQHSATCHLQPSSLSAVLYVWRQR